MRPLSSRLRFLPLTHAFDPLRAKRKIRDCSQSNTDSVSIIKIELKARRQMHSRLEEKVKLLEFVSDGPLFWLVQMRERFKSLFLFLTC